MTSTTSARYFINSTLLNKRLVKYFASVIIMLAVLITLNYKVDIRAQGTPGLILDFFILFLPFCFSFLLQPYFLGKQIFLNKFWFWMLLIYAPFIFVIRNFWKLPVGFSSFIHIQQTGEYMLASSQYVWRTVILITPVFIIWFLKHRNLVGFYGWKFSISKQLFTWLFIGMLPIVFFAATQPGFYAVYPKAVYAAGLDSNSNIWQWLLFELSYGLDFLGIEVFFRGFLIFAFIRYAGAIAIVPAACFYCCIHFDKPMTEAISSFFGGLLLGVISYQTRSIWTGFFLHLSMAWLMELASFAFNHG